MFLSNCQVSAAPLVTVIVAVYKDIEALNCVLWALERQTEADFEVIVTEDGEDIVMREFLRVYDGPLRLQHLSQPDIGFRKTRAVNRAIFAASAEYLIFLDGDTIPERSFIEWHLKSAERKKVCAGRRMHLGPRWSARIRKNPSDLQLVEGWLSLLIQIVSLHLDGVRNFEIGSPSPWLHRWLSYHYLNIVGCNFSCYKEDMLAINGYDEDLTGIGGEDDDLQWRFEGLEIHVKNVKFLAISYHLHHVSRRQDSDLNRQISARNRAAQKFVCERGVSQHLTVRLTQSVNVAKEGCLS